MGEAIVSMPSGAMSIRLAKITASGTGFPDFLLTRRTANSASPFFASAFTSRNS
jgi:hypothetical protein